MKKLFLSITVVFSLTGLAAQGQTSLGWGSDLAFGGTDLMLNSSGSEILLTDMWIIQMFTTTDGLFDPTFTTSFSTVTGTDSAVATGGSTIVAQVANGAFLTDTGAHDGSGALPDIQGLNIYSVIFNSTTILGATEYAIVDSSPFTVPAYDNLAPGAADYNVGGVAAGDWIAVAIPEPSTYAMMFLGAGLLVCRRKLRS